jgi:hypothetical protein
MVIENTKENSPVPQSALRLNSTQRQSMPVINGHHPQNCNSQLANIFRYVRSIILSNVIIMGKNHFSTTTQRLVDRFARDRRQYMPVSNGHHPKPQTDTAKRSSLLHRKHIEIHTHFRRKNSFHRRSMLGAPIPSQSTQLHARQ